MAEAEEDRLSESELQDVVQAALATSVPEAMFLTGVLEDAGIPAATRNDSVMGLGGVAGSVGILVPRVMLERAKAEIDKARGQTEQGKVEDAFDPQTIAERTYDTAKDPVLEEMFLLRNSTDKAELNNHLEPYVAHWLTEGERPAEIAKYLGAAGLSIEEAEALLEAMKLKHSGNISSDRDRRKTTGILLVVAGILLIPITTAAAVMTGRMSGRLMILPALVVTWGLIYLHQSRKALPVIQSKPSDKANPTSSKTPES